MNISAILAALFCATAPVAALLDITPKTEVTQSNFQLGKETVLQIRSTYENGGYNQFLTEMDASYKTADLSALAGMRQGKSDLMEQSVEAFEQQIVALQKEKAEALLAALSDHDDSSFAQKVRSLAANLLTPEQERGVSRLNSFIARAPGTGVNADEDKLIEIDLEYEFKLLHSSSPTQDISSQAKQIVLKMEKMDKMVAASKSFQDPSLKQAVGIAGDTFDARMARHLDSSDLNSLVKTKAKPANATEEKIFSVIALYQGKFSDLMKEISSSIR